MNGDGNHSQSLIFQGLSCYFVVVATSGESHCFVSVVGKLIAKERTFPAFILYTK